MAFQPKAFVMLDEELKSIRSVPRIEHPDPIRQAEMDGCVAGMCIALRTFAGEEVAREFVRNMLARASGSS